MNKIQLLIAESEFLFYLNLTVAQVILINNIKLTNSHAAIYLKCSKFLFFIRSYFSRVVKRDRVNGKEL